MIRAVVTDAAAAAACAGAVVLCAVHTAASLSLALPTLVLAVALNRYVERLHASVSLLRRSIAAEEEERRGR